MYRRQERQPVAVTESLFLASVLTIYVGANSRHRRVPMSETYVFSQCFVSSKAPRSDAGKETEMHRMLKTIVFSNDFAILTECQAEKNKLTTHPKTNKLTGSWG